VGTGVAWSTEWRNSIVWIVSVFVVTALGSAVLVALLSRYTVSGA
jgi:hypothetical protein